ncbi:MAG TPA: DNA starvation/stationary phase protection protein Dps [Gemmatimonadaceae bacterium]|jgi:starvation-inducible DNA-binding protein
MATATRNRGAKESAAPTITTSRNRGALDGNETLRVTKNDLPVATRTEVVRLLNARLADAIDLQSLCKQAHWNVRGPQFISLHKLFDDVYAAVGDYADLIAERVAQLGGTAEGTARVAAQRSTLNDYPLTLTRGNEHVAALSDVLSQFGRASRVAIEEMNDLQDAGSADIFTEISRGIDKWLWFVEIHGAES